MIKEALEDVQAMAGRQAGHDLSSLSALAVPALLLLSSDGWQKGECSSKMGFCVLLLAT